MCTYVCIVPAPRIATCCFKHSTSLCGNCPEAFFFPGDFWAHEGGRPWHPKWTFHRCTSTTTPVLSRILGIRWGSRELLSFSWFSIAVPQARGCTHVFTRKTSVRLVSLGSLRGRFGSSPARLCDSGGGFPSLEMSGVGTHVLAGCKKLCGSGPVQGVTFLKMCLLEWL